MAGCILIPTYLLKQKIRDYGKEIEGEFVRSVASDFRTSVTVALERLRVVEAASSFDRCILLAQRVRGDAEIRSLFFGLGLSPVLPRPEKYTLITDWLPNFPRHAFDRRDDSGSFATRRGRTIRSRQEIWGTAVAFFWSCKRRNRFAPNAGKFGAGGTLPKSQSPEHRSELRDTRRRLPNNSSITLAATKSSKFAESRTEGE